MYMIAQRQVYEVTKDSPRLISSSEATGSAVVSARHLVMMHDLSSCEHDIYGVIAKLSLYNLKDVKLNLDARILSSMLEIAQCTGLTITFTSPAAVPAIIQLDPALDNVLFNFTNGSKPGTFIVAPRVPQADGRGIGLSQIRVVMAADQDGDPSSEVGEEYVFVDAEGRIDTELLRSAAGRTGEQYKIAIVEERDVGQRRRWSMQAVDKMAGGIPIISEK